MVVRRRSMKENVLRNEIARVSSVRRRTKRGHSKDARASEIFSSSEISKAIIGKKGFIVE